MSYVKPSLVNVCAVCSPFCIGLLVDPVQPKLILDQLKTLGISDYSIKGILTTHHHDDHSGGNIEMLGLIPYRVPVYGGDSRIPALSHHLWENVEFPFPSAFNSVSSNQTDVGSFRMLTLLTPGHTKRSICYAIFSTEPGEAMHLFTGDTLFLSGCGRFFDGCVPQEMLYSLRLLKSLSTSIAPNKILVYPGHEYTLNNVSFALTVDPLNCDLQEQFRFIKGLKNPVSVPGTLETELKTNPFLRVE
ncbi:putative mitochondrial hydroxyacylglutathione hydrolase [Mitosporidium daphniae]|uniref:Putative mitochondrial hydroxyacylglutathione hydrolase n=1 Tax=Mitosporidium daphniae TaxID=1485682 RepID=A0A098VM55_9MICR|nr:putative mitochondrial hydroxyacylglutathione hydrolase [Mitosporidium daphniae]KGG50153.1 putative mitochondrial hydroxyacylglutathione hydrolase [Mitosporidium daphniae]|eukprot:XP_013236592.1 putative mitochondrial hydroxyacylglutathione hydrolase [Mitosporidium daphniae]